MRPPMVKRTVSADQPVHSSISSSRLLNEEKSTDSSRSKRNPLRPMVKRTLSADQPLPSYLFSSKEGNEKRSSNNRRKPKTRQESKSPTRDKKKSPSRSPIRRKPQPQCPAPPGILRHPGTERVSPLPRNSKKCVSFDTVEVREYPLTLDPSREDEPVMLTLSWECVSSRVVTVKHYDSIKDRHRKRTGGNVLKYELPERAGILLGLGMDIQELGQHLKGKASAASKGEDARKTAHPSKKSFFSILKDPANAGMLKA